MPERERFPRAPITEALLDIRVSFATPPDQDRLATFHDPLREQYPIREERMRLEGKIEVGAEVAQAVARIPEGYLFRSHDRQRAVQAGRNGFTVNWLKPYDTWQTLRDEARLHWDRYRDMFQPVTVNRLGLRYLNRLELPLPFNDFREYVRTAPDIAPGIPQGLTALFMRLEIPDPDTGLLAIVTETMELPVDDNRRLPLILDIDIVSTATFEPASGAIWETFENMREYKNRIFFASVTDRAKEMFR